MESGQLPEQGVTRELPVNPAPDERVPSGLTNDVVTKDQPITDPAQLQESDHPDENNSSRWVQNRTPDDNPASQPPVQ